MLASPDRGIHRPSRPLAAVGATLCCIALLGLTHCGYRVERPTLPSRANTLHVAPPDASAITDPSFASDLEVALVRQLGRRGVVLLDEFRADSVLRTRVVATETQEVVVLNRRAAGDRLAVSVVCWLTDRGGRTVWRSPILEQDRLRPMHGDAGQAEASRVGVLRSMAAHLASRVVETLLAERGPPSSNQN